MDPAYSDLMKEIQVKRISEIGSCTEVRRLGVERLLSERSTSTLGTQHLYPAFRLLWFQMPQPHQDVSNHRKW